MIAFITLNAYYYFKKMVYFHIKPTIIPQNTVLSVLQRSAKTVFYHRGSRFCYWCASLRYFVQKHKNPYFTLVPEPTKQLSV